MTKRVALVSCVKSKQLRSARAADLYTSPLFLGFRAYAEAVADEWFILSAKHGLLAPGDVVAPYEMTLNKAGVAERRRWAERVQEQLLEVLTPGSDVVILAGQRYREHLVPFLRELGHSVAIPLEGLQMGQQLQWLNAWRARDRDPPPPVPPA